MFIDASTIKDLEVIFNKRTGKADESLFGILNHSKTLQGGMCIFYFEILIMCPNSSTTQDKLAPATDRHYYY